MNYKRAQLELEFMQTCRARGPEWIESVIRPLRLPGGVVKAQDIPLTQLEIIVRLFGRVPRPTRGITVV